MIISEIDIVPTTAEYAKDIQCVLKESSRSMYLGCGYSKEDFDERFKDSLSDEAVNKCAENISSLSENEKYILAKTGDKVVGLCYVEKESSGNMLHAMYVLPEFQGRGIGAQLWENVKDFFDPTKDIILNVFVCNIHAINFYKKLGFADSGKRTADDRFTSKSGVAISEMEMVLIVE